MPDFTDQERLTSLANAGWSDVCDRVLAGLCHDLNGRVTSLAGMVQLLQLDEDSASMAPFLDQEVHRLEESVRLVRGLAGEPVEDPEAIHIPEILPELVQLASRHRYLETIESELVIEDGLMPVLGRWTMVGRGILLLFAIAWREAVRRGGAVTVTAQAGGDGVLPILVAVAGPIDEGVELPPETAREAGMAGIAAMLDAGWVEREFPDGIEFGLELPLLGRKS